MKKVLKITWIIALSLIVIFLGLLGYTYFRLRDHSDKHNLEELVSRQCNELIRKKQYVGMAVGIIRGGQVYMQGFGYRDRNRKTPVDSNTLFEIGSITKLFTAELTQIWVDKGMLQWDDNIADLLPKEYAPVRNDHTTLLHLVTHTSGYPRVPQEFLDSMHNECNPYSNISLQQYYTYIRNSSDKQAPKAGAYDYSNIGMSVLANILEAVSSRNYNDLLQKDICGPLGMTRTGLSFADTLNRATGYDENGFRTCYWDFPVMYGCGGIKSDISDMMRFAAANLNETNKLYPSLSAIQQQIYPLPMSRGIAKGWHTDKASGALDGVGTIIWHNGGTGGFHSYIGLVPASHVAIVILANESNDAVDQLAISLLTKAVKTSFKYPHHYIPR